MFARRITQLFLFALTLLLIGCGGTTAAPSEVTSNGGTRGCRDDEYSASMERVGVLRSTDHGSTWSFMGDACFHAPTLVPVDLSPLAIEGGIALYFFDLKTLNQPNAPRVIYRATTTDGLEFNKPAPAYTYPENMTDPYILQLPNGAFRMYVMSEIGILSASSSDGLVFTSDSGVRRKDGALPGLLLLPDNQVRMFLSGDPMGITSFISTDGLTFTRESGVRIPTSGIRTTDSHPIRLRAGGYLMVYSIYPPGQYADERARLASIEIHLASSSDGFNWTEIPGIIGHGGVPGLVEAADGTLFIYYVDVTYK
jgi:hypothetical protein